MVMAVGRRWHLQNKITRHTRTQTLECDKARMKSWLVAIAGIRQQEAGKIAGALEEKATKMHTV